MIRHILDKIEQYETVIIHRHERPDPDAIGSQAGLAALIQDTYNQKRVFIVGDEESSLTFLAEMDLVSDHEYEGALVIVCDTGNTERISDLRYTNGDYMIKIDHHPNEEPYGDLIWVDTSASSTSEMIVALYEEGKKRGYQLQQEAARLLYAGIVGDTGRFRYPNTTPATHYYTALLLEVGINHNEFYSALYKKDATIARVEGYVLQHFELTNQGLGVMTLTQEIMKKFGVTSKQSSLLVNAFSDVEGLVAWVFFVEDEDGKIRVRLRSKGPQIHMLAQQYSGGGHPLASGAKAKSWDETKTIIAELEALCKVYNERSNH
ncbi:bifunctional oligoribonuclease/PAP phosphatase NrnA [Alkalihalobacillus sp. LMS39]|uniref:DHH family phosphoesterase n=1 Tax=Alkalihalobacillus sp. LMS39 TaxID=2924032 RepID=UPI001FB4CADE|nr:bifunctional oligoribonuclease/PAP phosphatase NrnA [Alkalihalobacillus sp. LMS39]UOE93431.1 bifunctional oligoribonuclease/PAP phosphatase NrnA [Alkalihalobacillus sp. LMS39]